MVKPKPKARPKPEPRKPMVSTNDDTIEYGDMTEEFDCTQTDRKVTRKDCLPCSYFMRDKSYVGCGWPKYINGQIKRGGGKGVERYVVPELETKPKA